MIWSSGTIDVAMVRAGFASLAAELKAPVFLAELDARQARLILHARSGCDDAAIRSGVEAAMKQVDGALTVAVRTHATREMAFPRSVEAWLRIFCSGQPVYDPTGVAMRARALFDAARVARASFGTLISGMYFDPARREVLVRNRHRQSALGPGALAEIGSAIARAWSPDGMVLARVPVRSIDRLPNRVLIPVEDGAFMPLGALLRAMRARLASGAVALSLATFISPAIAKPDVRPFAATEAAGQGDTMAKQYGILAGLSLFGDGGEGEAGSFANLGLNHYFGSRESGPRTQSAEWRWIWEKEFWEPKGPSLPTQENPYGGY